jgi:hypothetical protein
MGGQINLAILMVGKLVFPKKGDSVRIGDLGRAELRSGSRHSPLIQPHIVLHKEQVLIGKVRGPQSGGQVDVL